VISVSSRWMRFTAVLFFFVGVLTWVFGRFGTARDVSVELAFVVEASDVSELSVSPPELEDAAVDMDEDMSSSSSSLLLLLHD